uniref:Uncharacterized protein n=1 Tax=Knipowitschia caucasica TaxID=637954 RepID=A0AAV2KJZ4_KNICA
MNKINTTCGKSRPFPPRIFPAISISTSASGESRCSPRGPQQRAVCLGCPRGPQQRAVCLGCPRGPQQRALWLRTHTDLEGAKRQLQAPGAGLGEVYSQYSLQYLPYHQSAETEPQTSVHLALIKPSRLGPISGGGSWMRAPSRRR